MGAAPPPAPRNLSREVTTMMLADWLQGRMFINTPEYHAAGADVTTPSQGRVNDCFLSKIEN